MSADRFTHLRARTLWFSARPDGLDHPGVNYLDDAVVTIEDGQIQNLQPTEQFQRDGGRLEDVADKRPGILMPGFIDTHIHYPQMDIIGSYGTQLLDWLERYAFPGELAYADRALADERAERFMKRLFEHGTTSALTFTTVHAHTTDALFEAAERVSACLIAGKVLMNRNAPAGLTDEGTGIDESRALIERWHGHGRLKYAITPRFAITCSEDQLRAAGALLADHPGVYMHSHIAEHPDEISATLDLFPEAEDYANVYERYGLLTDRSVFAHGIHLNDREMVRFKQNGARIAFCPSSNLFLGSGCLKLSRVAAYDVPLGVGSDVGGGTHFSLLATLGDGYKVSQLNGENWHPLTAFDAITRAGAEVLHLEDRIGGLAPGMDADFVVLQPRPGSLLAQRIERDDSLVGQLFAYLFLGTNDGVAETWVAGEQRYARDAA